MEEWPKPSILSSQTEVEKHHHHHRPVGVLGDTSGNVQTYAQDIKPGIENHVSVWDVPSLKIPAAVGGQYHFPPAPTLPSNDQGAANIARLHARRHRREHDHGFRRRFEESRPYLECHKYIEYRARRRQDTGEDGKPVWDDPMEEAFQNALVAIKPMGRKKKSQNGKPNGRNELIAEWIFHETGQQRTRKQVSSHIQVLNQLLKGIPEWDLLVAVPPDDGINPSSMEYFGNSIEQAVNSRRHFRQRLHDDFGHQYGGSAYGSLDRHQVSKLSFEMWVSLPEKMEEALHNYTRLQSTRSTAEPMMLENIREWRSMYPRLDDIINHWTSSERCDVIMLDASFQLMSDFPPKGSKLGISLELDFMDPSNGNHKALEDLQVWEGCTTIYDRGRKVREKSYDDCHSASAGKVKPFFESRYWATTFTDLTEKRRRAEDLKNDAAIEEANERSRSYLKHLTVIQEIYARPTRSQVVPRKRMAILLWKFSQVQPHWAVGSTTWRRVIPPPDRMVTNSPPPTQEMGLAPLVMDTIMDMPGNGSVFDPNFDFMSHFDPYQGYATFGNEFEEELCQDGSMLTKRQPSPANQFAAMQASFDMDSTQATASQEMHNMDAYSFDLPLHESQYIEHHDGNAASGNLFETQHAHHHHHLLLLHNEPPQANQSSQNQRQIHIPTDAAHELPGDPQHPLCRFDINTHRLLQAQLHDGVPKTDDSNDIDEEALRQALVAASAMNDLGSQPRGSEHRGDVMKSQQHSWTVPSTPLIRPQLHSHASFAAQSDHTHSHQQQYDSHHMAGINAKRMPAALSAPTQEDHYQSTGNSQALGSFHLDDTQSQAQYGSFGGSFVDVKDEVQSSMSSSFAVVCNEDMGQIAEQY